MNQEKVVKELEIILNESIEKYSIPFVRKNSVKIKNFIIRYNSKKDFYFIYDCSSNKQVAKTNFKSTALAIAKNLANGRNIVDRVLKYDRELLKYYNDALVYKNIIKKSANQEMIEVRKHRLELCIDRTNYIKDILDDYIFNFR